MALEYEELTGKIIAAAIEVHRRLGPGFLESVYENALVVELRKRGLRAAGKVHGLILNFDKVTLDIKRVINKPEGLVRSDP